MDLQTIRKTARIPLEPLSSFKIKPINDENDYKNICCCRCMPGFL